MKWLIENRERFRGQWVALEGDRFLAAGETAREVFERVSGRTPAPLVVRIDEEETPFAGW